MPHPCILRLRRLYPCAFGARLGPLQTQILDPVLRSEWMTYYGGVARGCGTTRPGIPCARYSADTLLTLGLMLYFCNKVSVSCGPNVWESYNVTGSCWGERLSKQHKA